MFTAHRALVSVSASVLANDSLKQQQALTGRPFHQKFNRFFGLFGGGSPSRRGIFKLHVCTQTCMPTFYDALCHRSVWRQRFGKDDCGPENNRSSGCSLGCAPLDGLFLQGLHVCVLSYLYLHVTRHPSINIMK